MTEAQMERAIEFLLDHQAQFAADISILKESQAETRSNIDRVVTNVDSVFNFTGYQRTIDQTDMHLDQNPDNQGILDFCPSNADGLPGGEPRYGP